jgi:general secretion pathway protein D
MSNSKSFTRVITAQLIIACLLCVAAPTSTYAKKGEKNFKQGIKYEQANEWDKAAQEFALALAAEPKDSEYVLHYRRAAFNASAMFMQKGQKAAKEEDYIAAYNFFRQAYSFDPTNRFAFTEMNRMIQRQQEEASGIKADDQSIKAADFRRTAVQSGINSRRIAPSKKFVQDINYSGEIRTVIQQIADPLDINVLYDPESFKLPRGVNFSVRKVTGAQALDYLLMQEGLFFEQVGARTVIIADRARAPYLQSLVARTFYLKNANPEEVAKLITASFQPQLQSQPLFTASLQSPQGRQQTIVVPNKNTHSLIVRDTAANVRLIEEIIKSVDKDRPEITLDVQIVEVAHSDLQQIGSQIGNEGSLTNGGIQQGLMSLLGGGRGLASQALASLPGALGTAFVVPASTISALQKRERSRVLARTQVHSFDGEETVARIGQDVPVQSAQVTPFGFGSSPTGGLIGSLTSSLTGNSTPNTGLFPGGGYPVFERVPTGLTLTFTPQVLDGQDVQVKLAIESKDVVNPGSLTPTFSERTISGMARIPNGAAMMLASISQDRQSQQRAGLPFVSGLPILGRFFAAPRTDTSQTEVFITVTPHVQRSLVINDGDEAMLASGTQQTPLSDTIEAMLQREKAAPMEPSPLLQPAAPAATQPAPLMMSSAPLFPSGSQTVAGAADVRTSFPGTPAPSPIPVAMSTDPAPAMTNYAPPNIVGGLGFTRADKQFKIGEKKRLAVTLKAETFLKGALLAVHYDPRVIKLRARTPAGAENQGAITSAENLRIAQAPDGLGLLLVSVSLPPNTPPMAGKGVLIYLEVEALAKGESELEFDGQFSQLIAIDGKAVPVRFVPLARVMVR